MTLASELNEILEKECPIAFESLSERGQKMFFPYKGILGQTAEAKGTKYNATIGIALDEDGSPLRLPSLSGQFPHNPSEILPYASSFGKQELREKWLEEIKNKNPSLKSQISLPVVTSGLTHGLDIVGTLFVDPGDQIILTDKYWGNYFLTFNGRYGAKLKTFNAFNNGGFDLDDFRESTSIPRPLPPPFDEAQGRREEGEPISSPPLSTGEGVGGRGSPKKIVLLNFPNNPTGFTPTDQEAEEIVSILIKSAKAGDKLVVILDDAYFGLVYEEGIIKESLFAKLASAHKNILAIKLDAISKEEYAWGLRVGFITFGSKGISEKACEALEKKAAGSVRASVSNVSHLSQTAVLQNLNSPNHEQEKREKFELLKKRYEETRKALKNPKYSEFFEPLPFNSGYFLSIELCERINAEELRKILLKDFDCGVISIGNMLRIAYSSLPMSQIELLFDRIYKACVELCSDCRIAATADNK